MRPSIVPVGDAGTDISTRKRPCAAPPCRHAAAATANASADANRNLIGAQPFSRTARPRHYNRITSHGRHEAPDSRRGGRRRHLCGASRQRQRQRSRQPGGPRACTRHDAGAARRSFAAQRNGRQRALHRDVGHRERNIRSAVVSRRERLGKGDRNRLPVPGRESAGGRPCRLEGLARAGEQWKAALTTRPDWVMVTSWNEWSENTQIETSELYGDFYRRRTAAWARRYRCEMSPPQSTTKPDRPC